MLSGKWFLMFQRFVVSSSPESSSPKMKAIQSFKMLGTACPVTRRNITDYMNLQVTDKRMTAQDMQHSQLSVLRLVFSDVMACSLAGGCKCCRKYCCLLLQGIELCAVTHPKTLTLIKAHFCLVH